MLPYRYEPRQNEPLPRQPLPVVNPKLHVEPVPQPVRQSPRPGRFTRMFQKILQFIFSSVCLTLIWFGIISQVGTITGNPKFDLFLWAIGILVFFYGEILTDNGARWAKKYCGLWGRKGR